MLLSSLADRTYLYEDHFHTLINNSDKHGRSSKHEAVEVERCLESMNGSERMSSEGTVKILSQIDRGGLGPALL